MTTSFARRAVVLTLAAALCAPLIGALTPAVARAQLEQAYTFRVPVKLTKLDPDLAAVVLRCYPTPSMQMAPLTDRSTTHVLTVANAQIDTVVVAVLKAFVPGPDQGSAGRYNCELKGRRATDPTGATFPLGPTATYSAFRVTPALTMLTQAFVW